jgi:hypothetical protein
MTGVPIEKQAEYSLLLDEKVKELVRRHIKEALEDPTFMGAVYGYHLSKNIMQTLSAGDINFQAAVKQVIVNQMNKF